MLHVGAGEGPGPIRERPEVVHLPAVRDLDPLAPAPGRVRREREFGIRFFGGPDWLSLTTLPLALGE